MVSYAVDNQQRASIYISTCIADEQNRFHSKWRPPQPGVLPSPKVTRKERKRNSATANGKKNEQNRYSKNVKNPKSRIHSCTIMDSSEKNAPAYAKFSGPRRRLSGNSSRSQRRPTYEGPNGFPLLRRMASDGFDAEAVELAVSVLETRKEEGRGREIPSFARLRPQD